MICEKCRIAAEQYQQEISRLMSATNIEFEALREEITSLAAERDALRKRLKEALITLSMAATAIDVIDSVMERVDIVWKTRDGIRQFLAEGGVRDELPV